MRRKVQINLPDDHFLIREQTSVQERFNLILFHTNPNEHDLLPTITPLE